MASEIRVNKINNRAGLGTVTYTDTGIIVSGIVTTTALDLNGDLDVDGHSNLDNVSIAGVVTATDLTVEKSGNLNVNIKSTGGWGALEVGGATAGYIDIKKPFSDDFDLRLMVDGSGTNYISSNAANLKFDAQGNNGIELGPYGAASLKYNNNTKLSITNTGAIVSGVLTATSFSGDGSSLSNLPAGAPVGGASTNTVFFENDKEVAVNYQITSTKNAMSAGPLTINAGIAVTVPSGCAWTIV